MATTKTNKMYLTQAEAKAAGLPSIEEQIDRWNQWILAERTATKVQGDKEVTQ